MVPGSKQPPPPDTTAHGALLHHLGAAAPNRFQPMNVNYGLFAPIPGVARRLPKREKYEQLAARALRDLEAWRALLEGGAA